MFSVSIRARSILLASAATVSTIPLAHAQTAPQELPPVVVQTERQPRPVRNRVAMPAPVQSGSASTAPTAAPAPLGVKTADQARQDIQQTPGGVAVVAAEEYKNNSVASTIKDILGYVPGVFAQPKWGDDTRLSIRGSGLSRNFHLRGVQLYMDGIPINTSDGYGDFQEIDPTAYKYVEVYKGANALQFGANSLGGAINFVTPTGRDFGVNSAGIDMGSFGYRRFQGSVGGANGPWDAFFTASNQSAEGFRDHSYGHSTRASGNIGYQFSPDFETRFYINANDIRQRIPGSVTRASALTSPETAAAGNVINDQQRNIDSGRIANKTTVRFGATTVEFGAFAVDRHLMHPIFQWLDYQYKDYGGFGKVTDDRVIGGFRNRLVAGVNVVNGEIDNKQYQNIGGYKGALLSSSLDKSKNTSAYVENSFYFLPNVAAIGGTQFLYATRDRTARFGATSSGSTEFNLWSPKAGLLWDIDPTWQAFANISRSAEVPSFGESSAAPAIPFYLIQPQTATTYEIGTRGRRPDLTWELTGYRAEIKNELQCMYGAPGQCNVVNADRTVHQGIEAGLGVAVLKNVFTPDADKVWINLSYTYNDFRFDNDPVFGNNQLPGAPRHFLRAEALYKHANGFYIGPNIEWVPQAYYVDNFNTFTTAAYAIWGLKAGVDDGKYSMYLEARNIANTAYIASTSITRLANAASPLFEPGTGRAVYAGMKVRW
ncbi:MAG: TonB-dependent receptor [Afipia sp.]|jgi:iron complex outermembrane receptor protein|nr:TonB-dependent receptor [Afipia sp.]MBS4006064.1 TonB-dependent receptor [Afipia sp.]WIG50686.1 MAG: TonB-dependent receptor [Afipia sp.]